MARFRTPLLAALLAALAAAACDREPPPGATSAPKASSPSARSGVAGDPTLPEELAPQASAPAADDAGAPPPPHPGPWLVVTSPAAAVYSAPVFEKTKKLGYARNGGRLPVKEKPVSTENCSNGWYQVISGGYVCGNQGTTDLTHPQVRFTIKQPDLDEVLPYQYARNAKNGTPLYKSVPSKEQMHEYEPYLPGAKKARERDGDDPLQKTSMAADAGSTSEKLRQALIDAGLVSLAVDGGGDDPEKPWWQKDKDKLHEVTLEQLEADSDDVLAKRMVAGFYIAVDKTFTWNGRTWYKSTKGLIAPQDRFWLTPGSKFKGVELGDEMSLPVAWVYGGRKTAPLYEIGDDEKLKASGSVEAFTAVGLTGRTKSVGKTLYRETKDNRWIRDLHVRVTSPGPAPKDLAPGERWFDVNLSQQTLVAYQGTRPVYATLVSTGKSSTIKEKDHRTPVGQWRIREKHITTTMDGNGTAAGDLPYSIEDVPFVMYYYNSYALHGAFWHRNFGIQMSHGCVNLAPLDAKYVFNFSGPHLPAGYHGAWASSENPGSRVVVHD